MSLPRRLVRQATALAVVLISFGVVAGPVSAQTLYALCDPNYAHQLELRTLDLATGATRSTIGPVMIGPDQVGAANGMAMDPITGIMYFLRRSPPQLCTVDLVTGAAVTVGSMPGTSVWDLTFDAAGQLYGTISPIGSDSAIVLIDKSTAAVSIKVAVNGPGDDSIAFDPANPDRLFHRSLDGFESINIADNSITDIGLSCPGLGATGMVWDGINHVFLYSLSDYWWIKLTSDGLCASSPALTLYIYALAFDQETTVPVELVAFSVD